MNPFRTWAAFFLCATVACVVYGIVSVMKVRLLADEVGQHIRRLEHTTEERRKELGYIERERSKAQDVLRLERRVGEDLRAPEPSQVIWVRASMVRPAMAPVQNPRVAALDSAFRDSAGPGGGTNR